MELKPQPRFSDTVPVVPGVSPETIDRMDREWRETEQIARRMQRAVIVIAGFVVIAIWRGWI